MTQDQWNAQASGEAPSPDVAADDAATPADEPVADEPVADEPVAAEPVDVAADQVSTPDQVSTQGVGDNAGE
jgi:hypothetical protein